MKSHIWPLLSLLEALVPFSASKPCGRASYIFKSGSEYLIFSLCELPLQPQRSRLRDEVSETYWAGVWPQPCSLLKRQQVRVGLRVFRAHSCAFTAGGAIPQQDLLAQADATGSFPWAGGGGQPGIRPWHLLPDVAGLRSGVQLGGIFVDEVWDRQLQLGLMVLLASFSAPVFHIIFTSSTTYPSINFAAAFQICGSFALCCVQRQCDLNWLLVLLLALLLLLLAVLWLLLCDEGQLVGRGKEGRRVSCVGRGNHRVRWDHHVLGGLQRPREPLFPWCRRRVKPREGVEGGDVTGRERGRWRGTEKGGEGEIETQRKIGD